MKKFLSVLFAAVSLSSAFAQQQRFVGGDISLLPSYEAAGDVYLSYDGSKIDDLITYLHETCGWNAARVRLFVNPDGHSNDGKSEDPAVCQDLEYVANLGKRIKDAGMAFLLDFHYSDTWADPSYQKIPSRWTKDNDEVLADSVYQYTKDCLNQLIARGATPDFVQIGNEITYGMLLRNDNDKVYPSQDKSERSAQWKRLSTLLTKASKAVREACSGAKIIVHTERSGKAAETANFYAYISDVDYDIIGLSYYPFWHGDLKALGSTLDKLAETQSDKQVQIVETAYYHQYFPKDATYNTTSVWPANATGQYKFVSDLVSALADRSQVDGLYYWFPEECGNGYQKEVLKGWVNRGLWDEVWQAKEHKPITKTSGKDDGALYILRDFAKGNGAQSLDPTLSDVQENSVKYNIAGQPISQPTRGELYIQRGKKRIVR